MRIKTGKEEIVYLLTKVIEKYESETGHRIVRNSNRRNYEDVARRLSDISNALPSTAVSLQHDKYPPDTNPQQLEYPFRKYDITGNQIKDAYFNSIVSKPRPFLVEACYIYLYGVGRKGFEKNPADPHLIDDAPVSAVNGDANVATADNGTSHTLARHHEKPDPGKQNKKKIRILLLASGILVLLLVFTVMQWLRADRALSTLKKDMNLLSYQPTQQEIDSLEGVWLCYTGSPQARLSDPRRYHMVVSNVVDVKYKDGYFVFARYGASFDHIGYMQYEAPWLVSVHSYVKNGASVESPRHSLLRLNEKKPFFSAISASWNFDVGVKNSIIGIREVYIKQGKGGTIEEVMNTIENASCKCKILQWHKPGGQMKVFQLKNVLLDSLPDKELRSLIDEKSILLRLPEESLIYTSDSAVNNGQKE